MAQISNEPSDYASIDFALPHEMFNSLSDKANNSGMDVSSYTRMVICSYLRLHPEEEAFDSVERHAVG
jgi:hypothetical protein